jgi:hypothetical protein
MVDDPDHAETLDDDEESVGEEEPLNPWISRHGRLDVHIMNEGPFVAGGRPGPD